MIFDVDAALKDGAAPSQIADFLAEKKNFDIATARKDGATDDQIIKFLNPKPKKESLLTDVQRGAELLASGLRTGTAGIFNPNEAAEAGIARTEDITSRLGGEESRLAKVERAYKEKGLFPAIGAGLKEIPSAIAEQAPQLATAFGGARLGAMAVAPFAPMAGPAAPIVGAIGAGVGAFLPSFIQQYGGNIQEQAQLQKEKGEKVDVNAARAAAFAVPMGALDVAESFIPFGGNVVSKIIGKDITNLFAKGATKEAEEAALKKLTSESFLPSLKNRDFGTVIKGTTKATALEVPTEVTQQMLGRAQAGKDLFSPEALREYGETAFDIALLGPLGIYGRVADKADARLKLIQAQKDAIVKDEPQEVQLLTYDPNVQGNTIYTPIIVNPDGSTQFPSERNQFVPNATDEFTQAGLKEAYPYPKTTEVEGIKYAQLPPSPPVTPPRQIAPPLEIPPIMYGTSTGEVSPTPEAAQQAEEFKKIAIAKQQEAQRIVTPEVIRSLGIFPTATIFKSNVIGQSLSDPNVADSVREQLLKIKKGNKNESVKTNIDQFLQRPEFNTPKVKEESLIPEGEGKFISIFAPGPNGYQSYKGKVSDDEKTVTYTDDSGKVQKINSKSKNVIVAPTEADLKQKEIEHLEDTLKSIEEERDAAGGSDSKFTKDFKAWLRKNPLSMRQATEVGIIQRYKDGRPLPIREYAHKGYLSPQGLGSDELALAAYRAGFLTDQEYANSQDTEGENAFMEMVRGVLEPRGKLQAKTSIEDEARFRQADDAINHLQDEIAARRSELEAVPTEEQLAKQYKMSEDEQYEAQMQQLENEFLNALPTMTPEIRADFDRREKELNSKVENKDNLKELSTEKKSAPPKLAPPAGLVLKKGRNEQVVLAARALAAKKITKEEFDAYVDYHMPINTILGDKLEAPIEDSLMKDILLNKIKQKKKPELINASIADGTKVGLRMDIPALDWGRENGVNGSVVSIHKGSSPENKTQGENIGYKSAGAIKNVVFATRSQETAFKIAQQLEPEIKKNQKTGKEYIKDVASKSPQQTIEGSWVNMSPNEIMRQVKENLNNPAWKQISLDPLRHSYFYDRDSRQPVISADEVLQVGRFVLAKNVKFGKKENFLYEIPYEATPALKQNIDELTKRIQKSMDKMGLHGVGVRVGKDLKALVNGKMKKVNGLYLDRLIVLSLDNPNIMSTFGHEQLHALRDMGMFSDKEWDILSKKAKSEWIKKYDIERRYKGKSEEIKIEEAIASAFGDYTTMTGAPRSLFTRIKEFFDRLRNAFMGMGFKTSDMVFDRTAEDVFRKATEGRLEGAKQVGKGDLRTENKVVDITEKREEQLFDEADKQFHKDMENKTKEEQAKKGIEVLNWMKDIHALHGKVEKIANESLNPEADIGAPIYWELNKYSEIRDAITKGINDINNGKTYSPSINKAQRLVEEEGSNIKNAFNAYLQIAKKFQPKYNRSKSFGKERKDALNKILNNVSELKAEIPFVQVPLSQDEQKYFVSVFNNKSDKAELLDLVPSARLSGTKLIIDPNEMSGLDDYLADTWAAGKKQYGGEGASTLPKSFASAGYKFLQKAKKANAEPMFEIPMEGVDPKYAEDLNSVFGPAKKATVEEKFKELKPNFFNRLIQGVFDEFHSIKKYDDQAYMKAVLSKSVDGALDGLLMSGQVYIKDGALDIKRGTKGLTEILEPLGTDVERYQIWKALNRDIRLPENKRSFNKLTGNINELVKGDINGKSRKELYNRALEEEKALNKSVLDVAKQQGIIDNEAYKIFSEDMFYIPFYKEMENGEVSAIQASSKLANQKFSHALKGGEKERVGDLMENVLRNWSHILSASMKNAAAVSTLKAATKLQAATQVKSTYEGKDVVKVMENGKQAYYAVNDPNLIDSISLISYLGPKSVFTDVAKSFTNALRYGVTLSPGYKIRNLLRDTVASAAISPVGMNMLDTVQRGMSLSDRGNPTFISALAGGGVFELGAAHEGNQAALVKRLIAKGVKEGAILDTPDKIKNALKDALEKYNEFGNRFENANRLALFDKMTREGKSHLEASFAARDLLNFTGQGSFRAIKFVSQVVPFFNTRLQGLYKLGRDGVTPTYRVLCNMTTGKPIEESDRLKAQRFSIVSTAVMLASIGLYMSYKDDDDFKKREDWDRDNFWWFKIGDEAFRIPKPFEIGALGTIAERSVEQIMDESVEGQVFGDRLRAVIMDNLSMNPTPQVVKPIFDLYANKDSFTSAPIETSGMERLSKQERVSNNTSELGKLMGGVSEVAAKILTFNPQAQGLSPVQMDYALKSYFGWLGSTVATVSDKAVQPWSDVEKPGKPLLDQYSMGFIKSLPETQSKYVTNFYNNSNRINEAFADMKRFAENNEQEKVAEILKEKGDLISLQKIYSQTTDQMASYRKYINIITNNKNMSREDKENEILRMKVLISQLAENAENIRKSLKK